MLSVGNKRVPAHRLVLSAGSEYFAAMFTSSLRESAQNEIELMDVDGDALWALVLYCYTGNPSYLISENISRILLLQ